MDGAPYTFDLHRIFLGDLPWTFVLEIAFRTGVMFTYALLMVRVIGKRGLAQITPFEYLLIVAIGSSVGDPMVMPDVPLLHGMAVLTFVVLLHQAYVRVTERSERLEALMQGETVTLVADGRMNIEAMHEEGISDEELFEGLRLAGVEHLGEVRRAYLEMSGNLSVFRYAAHAVRPGLPLTPACDAEAPGRHRAGAPAEMDGPYACWRCGEVVRPSPGAPLAQCPRCGGAEWAEASGEGGKDERPR